MPKQDAAAKNASSEMSATAPSPGKGTLWAKDLPLDAQIHQFTVGRDPELDLALYGFDCIASAAHVRMLAKVDLLKAADEAALLKALHQQYLQSLAGEVRISQSQEDCHTALESALVEATGEAGKRIHLGRSRNDQVLVALRLFLRQQMLSLAAEVAQLAQVMQQFAVAFEQVALPGFTHMRRAMPSSFGQWASGFAEGLAEELDAASGVHARINRCPLGAAAGFGVPLPLDRAFSAELLGFARVQRSTTDCMNSRGRHEQAVLDWCVSIAGTLEKLLWDLALFSSDEFGFLKLPDAYTTGSSIMPQKRNPDVVELARAKCRALRGIADTHRQIMSGLPSSYHRDFQLGKAPLMEGLAITHELLSVLVRLFPALIVNVEQAKAACSDELHAAHAAYLLVANGMPFRDAYRAVAAEISIGKFVPPALHLEEGRTTHLGHPNNLGLHELSAELNHHAEAIRQEQARVATLTEAIWQ